MDHSTLASVPGTPRLAGQAPPFAALAAQETVAVDELHKRSEILAAIRSNLAESSIDAAIKARMTSLLDELDLHLGVATFQAKRAALASFAAAHFAVLFPVLGPLIDTLGDPS